MYYLVNFDGQIEEKKSIEEWENQYFEIYENKEKAYISAYNKLKEFTESSEKASQKLIIRFRKQYLELLFKYEKDTLKKFPAWYHKEVKKPRLKGRCFLS